MRAFEGTRSATTSVRCPNSSSRRSVETQDARRPVATEALPAVPRPIKLAASSQTALRRREREGTYLPQGGAVVRLVDEEGLAGGGLFGEQKFNRAGSARLTNSEVLGQAIEIMARVTGLEPATSGVTGRRSNQLSYTRKLCARDRRASRARQCSRSLSITRNQPSQGLLRDGPRLAQGVGMPRASSNARTSVVF